MLTTKSFVHLGIEAFIFDLFLLKDIDETRPNKFPIRRDDTGKIKRIEKERDEKGDRERIVWVK